GVGRPLSVAEPLAVLAAQERAPRGGEDRRQGGVLVGSQRPVIGNAEMKAVRRRIAEARLEKAAAPLYRGVGVREVGCPQDRDAVDVHLGIAVFDDLLFLVMDDLLGPDLPDRRSGRVLAAGVAGRVDATADFEPVPVDAAGGV